MAQSQSQVLGEAPVAFARERRLPFYVDVLRRLVREKPLGLIGGLLVIMFFIMAIAAPVIAPYGKNELILGAPRLSGPTLDHWMGTDNLGRDVFSRVVYGAQVSMTIGVVAVFFATLLSLFIGVFSGYFSGWFDMLVQRFVDAFIAFPGLVFIIAVGAIFYGYDAPGLPRQGVLQTDNVVLMVTIGILLGVGSSRIIRGATLTVKSMPYIEASRAVGATNARLVFMHVIPNVLPAAITLATLGLGTAILLEASLGFLGLGVPPDTPTWGGMLNREARSQMTNNVWLAVFPGLALSLAVFGINMLGDALRDLLDPRLRTG